jgi:hypothetical protein
MFLKNENERSRDGSCNMEIAKVGVNRFLFMIAVSI